MKPFFLPRSSPPGPKDVITLPEVFPNNSCAAFKSERIQNLWKSKKYKKGKKGNGIGLGNVPQTSVFSSAGYIYFWILTTRGSAISRLGRLFATVSFSTRLLLRCYGWNKINIQEKKGLKWESFQLPNSTIFDSYVFITGRDHRNAEYKESLKHIT